MLVILVFVFVPGGASKAPRHKSPSRPPAEHPRASQGLHIDLICAETSLQGLQDLILMPTWMPPALKSLKNNVLFDFSAKPAK